MIKSSHCLQCLMKCGAIIGVCILPVLLPAATVEADPVNKMRTAIDCDKGMRMVDSHEFESATNKGEGLVVSYDESGSPLLRAQHGFTIAVSKKMGGLTLDADVNIRNSETGMPDGERMHHVMRDMNITHKAFKFVSIGDSILTVENLDGGEENLPFDSNTRLCVSK